MAPLNFMIYKEDTCREIWRMKYVLQVVGWWMVFEWCWIFWWYLYYPGAEDMFCSLDSGPMVMRDSNPNTWREQSRSSFWHRTGQTLLNIKGYSALMINIYDWIFLHLSAAYKHTCPSVQLKQYKTNKRMSDDQYQCQQWGYDGENGRKYLITP